jgi:hypothetical protein
VWNCVTRWDPSRAPYDSAPSIVGQPGGRQSGLQGSAATPADQGMSQSSVCGPERYSGGASELTRVSSSRMIVTGWSSHSGTGMVTANSSETQSPFFSVMRG